MGMSRAQKEDEIKELNGMFSNDELVVVTHYSGLNMPQMTELRSELRKEGCLLYTSPSPRDRTRSRMPSSA